MIAKRLKKGGTIGLIAPSSPESYDKIKSSIELFKSLGFKIKEGKHISDKWGYLAGNDEDRAHDFNDMFLDDTVDMVLCIRGGYGTMRILSMIDFNLVKEHPKIFAGFSDITTLLNIISSKCNLVTFHSPMCTSNFLDKATSESFFNTIMNGYENYTIKNPENFPAEYKSNVPEVSGQLVGGNLSLISSTMGTPYEIDTKDKILFIEDVGEDPYKIDRMLTQLLLDNKLQECKAFVLGQFTRCTLPHYERSLTLEEVLEDRLLSLNKPTLINLQSGHSYPRLTIPIGAKVVVNFKSGFIKTLEPVVK
ncbi:LD-carboxypeptidase [Clostridium sp. JN-1]|uniref:S66 peptidase family protein n=1 Tax=Clostridium sp. JN-1 TaxID=2483110 RepID=UPI000F0BCE02|nr:LD-carboxypeptidase [Clostridium sp. JN-1]